MPTLFSVKIGLLKLEMVEDEGFNPRIGKRNRHNNSLRRFRMKRSYCHIYLHIIWSTKNREPLINEAFVRRRYREKIC
jgi:hypothetical protein